MQNKSSFYSLITPGIARLSNMDVLGVLFPKKCVGCRKFGAYICTNCFASIQMQTTSICGVCGRSGVDGITHPRCVGRYTIDGVSAALVYRGFVKRLIYQYKFDPHLFDMTQTLGDFLYESVIQQEPLQEYLGKDTVMMPVPLSKRRLRERGYNQAELLAKYLSKRLGVRYINISYRTRDTAKQVGKKEGERRENVKGAFIIKGKVVSERVIIIDDIVTSGATMNELAKMLKKNGVKKVWGLALAHGE